MPAQRVASIKPFSADFAHNTDSQLAVDSVMEACWPVLQENIAEQLLTANEASAKRLQQVRSDVSVQLKSAQDHNQLVRQKNAQQLRQQESQLQSAIAELSGRVASQEVASSALTSQQEAFQEQQMNDRLLLNNSIRQLRHEVTADAQRQRRNQQDELQEGIRRAKATLSETVAVKQAEQQQNVESRMQDVHSKQQQDWASALEAVAALQTQQEAFHQLPQELKDVQKQLAQIKGSINVSLEAAVQASEEQQILQMHTEMQSLQAKQLEQQEAIHESIRFLQLQQVDLQKLPEKLYQADQRLQALKNSTWAAIQDIKGASSQGPADGTKAASHQEDLEAALSSIAWLQAQQASFQELPGQLQETQQQLVKLQDSVSSSISSQIAAAQGKQQSSLRQELNDQMQQHTKDQRKAGQSMADLHLQQQKLQRLPGQLQEVHRELQRVQDSLKTQLQSSLATSEARQQEQMMAQLKQLEHSQSEHRKAAEKAMLSLQANQPSLEQLLPQIHQIQQQLAEAPDATHGMVQSAVASYEARQDQHLQSLAAQQQQQQESLEQALGMVRSQQEAMQQLPQQLQAAQQQLDNLKEQLKATVDASTTAAASEQAAQFEQLKGMQDDQQVAAGKALAELQAQQALSSRLQYRLQEVQVHLKQQESTIKGAVASALSASEDAVSSKVQEMLQGWQAELRQQQGSLQTTASDLSAHASSIEQLKQQQRDAHQQVAFLQESLGKSIQSAVSGVEDAISARLQDAHSQQQKEREAAAAVVTDLQSQLTKLQHLPRQYQETQQQLARVDESTRASISSAMTDLDDAYSQRLNGLQQQQQQQDSLVQEVRGTLQAHVARVEDTSRQLHDVTRSLESLVQASVASAIGKQHQQMHEVVKDLEDKQAKSQQAVEDSTTMLDAQQGSLQQLSQQLQEAHAKVDQLQDTTSASLDAAMTQSEHRQQQHMQDLIHSLQAKQSEQLQTALASMESVRAEQSDLAELPKELLDVQRQLTSLEQRQSDLKQLPMQQQEQQQQLSLLQASVTNLQSAIESQPSSQQAANLTSIEKSVHALQVMARTGIVNASYIG